MKYTPVGVDIAKHLIQVHFINEHTGEVVDKQIRSQDFLMFFSNREPCLIGMEACGGSQHWARELTKLGHRVRLLQARFVKAFVMGNKNDVMDARAIWMAVQQPGKEIAVKTEEQQSMNRPEFPGECFICELRLPDHRFRWKHNKLFLLLPEGCGPAFPAIVDCYTSPPT